MAKKKQRTCRSNVTLPGDSAATLVEPGVYLGPRSAAKSKAFLTAARITHILSVGVSPLSNYPNITYERLRLVDSPDATLRPIVDAAATFLDSTLANKDARVLVHCQAGISRSPAILIGWMIVSLGIPLREALGAVIRARPAVKPNSGFLAQLQEMERDVLGRSTMKGVEELPRRTEDRLAMFARA